MPNGKGARCGSPARMGPGRFRKAVGGMAFSLRDLCLLVRLRVSLMVGAATAFGYLLAVPLPFGSSASGLVFVTAGTMLLTGACSAWNQAQERDTDALLPRTWGRPLPAGRMTPLFAVVAGATLFAAAVWCLSAVGAATSGGGMQGGGLSTIGAASAAMPAPGGRLALWGVCVVAVYNGLYTPLKRVTSFAMLPGALAGAMPPLFGWVAAGGALADPAAILLYGVYVLWQIPHFWLRALRDSDAYARARLPVPPAQYAADRFRRLLRVWYHAYAVAVLMLPVFPLLKSPLPRAGVVLLGVALLIVAALPDRRAKAGGLALRVADAAMPALMLLLLLDRVLLPG